MGTDFMTARRGELPPMPEALPASVIDAHTHLDACGAQTPESVAKIMNRANTAGVDRVITVGDDLAAAIWAATAATWDSRIFAAVAVHPTRTADFSDQQRVELENLAQQPRVVAIGETGLDYYWDYASRESQWDAFRWHIELAKSVRKPLMIHDREAHQDILRLLDEQGAPSTVVFHCFSGDLAFAKECVSRGYSLSLAGTVTFRNAHALREVAEWAPSEHILVETDAPFLTPHPYRGQPNEPYCANYTVRALAHVRGMKVADMARQLTANAERIFALPTS